MVRIDGCVAQVGACLLSGLGQRERPYPDPHETRLTIRPSQALVGELGGVAIRFYEGEEFKTVVGEATRRLKIDEIDLPTLSRGVVGGLACHLRSTYHPLLRLLEPPSHPNNTR